MRNTSSLSRVTNRNSFQHSIISVMRRSEKKKSVKATKGEKLLPEACPLPCFLQLCVSVPSLFPLSLRVPPGIKPATRHRAWPHREKRARACVCAHVCVGLCSRAVYSLAHSSLSSLFLSTTIPTRSEYHPFPLSQSSSSPNSLLLNYPSPFRSHLTNPSVFPSAVGCDLSILLCSLLHHLFMSSLSLSLSRYKTRSRLLATGVVAITMETSLIDVV